MAKKKASPQTVASSFGMAALGVVVLIVGTVLKSHFQLNAAICNTYGGSTSHCVANGTAFTIGQVMQPVGGIMIGIGLILGVLLLVSGNSASKPTGSPQTSGTPRTRTQPDPSAKVIDTQKLSAPREVGEQRRPPVNDKNDW
jgi:hypothetical protein